MVAELPYSRELDTCLRCGYCRAVCPTWKEVGWESASPRGKAFWLRRMSRQTPLDRMLGLDAGVTAHALNAPVTVTLALRNTGAPVDLIVQATVTAPSGEEPAGGLPLVTLHALTETATVDLVWDSAGFAPGFYTLDVELLDMDNAGAVLARRSDEFQLGVAAAQIEDLVVAPTLFRPGDPVTIDANLRNTGDVSLSGTARVQIVGLGALTTTLTFTDTVSGLAPGTTRPLTALWDTTGAAEGDYLALVSLLYEGRVSNIATTRFGTRTYLYLPGVIKQ